jgi:hypothetical protein
MQISHDWLQTPRESFDAGGWDEMVGPENVRWGIVEDADHDTLIESEELVSLTALVPYLTVFPNFTSWLIKHF